MATGAGGPRRINAEKLSQKIGTIVEQPVYSVGAGGLASTETDSYAQARALLILAALQIYPVLMKRKEDFPDDFRITALKEADPRMKITDTATHIRAEDPALPNSVCIHIAVRSESSLKPLYPEMIRNQLFRALALWKYPSRGDAFDDFVGSLTKQYETEMKGKVPADIIHLKLMKVLPEDYIHQYNVTVGLEKAPAAGDSPTKSRLLKGSAVTLWWPVSPEAITYQEAMEVAAAVRSVVAAEREEEAMKRREAMRQAALARASSNR